MIPALLPIASMFTFSVIEQGQACDPYRGEREQMVNDIAALAKASGVDTGRPVFSERVMAALAKVPRHRLVPPEFEAQAYADYPLPIGQGQTISQPYIVALMSDLLDVRQGHRILEIGTGSGYQAAILAELGACVYSMEIVTALGERARETLRALGYANVNVRIGDGYVGWPEQAPFDAIILTAATPVVPQPLLDQLKVGGRLVIPLGEQSETQQLLLVEKAADGTSTRRRTLPVRFVPLTRAQD